MRNIPDAPGLRALAKWRQEAQGNLSQRPLWEMRNRGGLSR